MTNNNLKQNKPSISSNSQRLLPTGYSYIPLNISRNNTSYLLLKASNNPQSSNTETACVFIILAKQNTRQMFHYEKVAQKRVLQ